MSAAADPGSGRAPWARRALALSLAAAFGVWVFPELQTHLGLNLTALVEPYFLRENRLNELAYFLAIWSRPVLLPFAVFVAYRILARVLGVQGAAGGPASRSALRRVGGATWWLSSRGYLGACALLVGVELVAYVPFTVKLAMRPSATLAFREACGRCHDRRIAWNYSFTAPQWAERVERHGRIRRGREPYSSEHDDAIVELLVATRGYSDARLLRSKCLACHLVAGRPSLGRARSQAEWRGIVERLRREQPFFLSVAQADQLALALAEDPDRTRPAPHAGSPEHPRWAADRTVEARCAPCHELDVVLEGPDDAERWLDVLARMERKSPARAAEERWSEGQRRELAVRLAELRDDPAALRASFPHATSLAGSR